MFTARSAIRQQASVANSFAAAASRLTSAPASAFAAAYVVGYVILFAPAGLGVREGVLVFMLSPHLGAGTAGAVAAIARLWTTLVEIVPAAAFWGRRLTTADAVTEARDGPSDPAHGVTEPRD